jgi:hypothetical protein
VEPRSLGAVRLAISVAALACVLPAWSDSHGVSIGAIVVAPSGCRFSAGGYRCDGVSASTVSWSFSHGAARLSGTGAAANLRGALATLDADGAVLTITP